MTDINPIHRLAPTPINGSRVNGSSRINPSSPTRGSDSVEFSGVSRLLAKLHDLPDVRQGLVDRVKSEIASGTYETPEKLDAAITELAQDL
ncbi:MAG: flagellar biosynthesis protein FlgM [Phycisphaera sp.]|nr:flagellar biosynthesis protein FlgM [Phycisphaera sp.]